MLLILSSSSPRHPPPGYLCRPEANCYDIEFIRFKIRDMQSGLTLFEIAKCGADGRADSLDRGNGCNGLADAKEVEPAEVDAVKGGEEPLEERADRGEPDPDEQDEHQGRFVRYEFTPQFLKLKTVGAT